MALSDPQSVTIGASTIPLPRVGQGLGSGTFTSADGNTTLSVLHQATKAGRFIRKVQLINRKIAADPFQTTVNGYYLEKVTISMDVPAIGYTPTELLDALKGLIGNLSASTYANGVKFIGGES